jgi:hypothetical protein
VQYVVWIRIRWIRIRWIRIRSDRHHCAGFASCRSGSISTRCRPKLYFLPRTVHYTVKSILNCESFFDEKEQSRLALLLKRGYWVCQVSDLLKILDSDQLKMKADTQHSPRLRTRNIPYSHPYLLSLRFFWIFPFLFQDIPVGTVSVSSISVDPDPVSNKK